MLLLGPRIPVFAQAFDVAPIEVFTQGRYDPDNKFGQIVVGGQRAMPVSELLPQVTADSYFDLVKIVVGGQFDEQKETRFRYRLTAIKTEIQKSPWGSQFTFIDYNATGLEDLWADWVSLSVGPGFHVGSETTQFVVRVLGHGAFNTYRFGDVVYGELGKPAGKTRTGAAYGGSARVALVVQNKLTIRGAYDLFWQTAGPDPRKDAIDASVEYKSGGGLGVFATFSSMKAELEKLSQKRNTFGAGVRYTLGVKSY